MNSCCSNNMAENAFVVNRPITRGTGNLYHGTTKTRADAILAQGYKAPTDRNDRLRKDEEGGKGAYFYSKRSKSAQAAHDRAMTENESEFCVFTIHVKDLALREHDRDEVGKGEHNDAQTAVCSRYGTVQSQTDDDIEVFIPQGLLTTVDLQLIETLDREEYIEKYFLLK